MTPTLKNWLIPLLLALSASGFGQSFELPKVNDVATIGFGYNNNGRGTVRLAGKDGAVQQWLEVWEDKQKIPTVVTYVLFGAQGVSSIATWGRGPVDMRAFTCDIPEGKDFSADSFWVATVSDGRLSFQAVTDSDVKGLFANLGRMRQAYDRNPVRISADVSQQNIVSLFKEKTRKKWVTSGWLQPTTACRVLDRR